MSGTRDEWINHINIENLVTFLQDYTEIANIGGFIVNLNGEKISQNFNPAFVHAATYVPPEFYQPQKVIALINQSVERGFASFKGLVILPFPITINEKLQGFILLLDKAAFDDHSTVYGNYHWSHTSFNSERVAEADEWTQKSNQRAIQLSRLFFKMSRYMVAELLDVHMEIHQAQMLSSLEKNTTGKIEIIKAINYMKENLDQPLTLKDVADQVYFSQGYFSKLFKKELNMNFVEYLNIQRVQKASRLLTTSNLKIDQISKQVGFSQTSYFCKIFKEVTQASPVAYRRQSRKAAAVG